MEAGTAAKSVADETVRAISYSFGFLTLPAHRLNVELVLLDGLDKHNGRK